MKRLFESLVIVMILLVLIQTFLEDFSVFAGFSQINIVRIKLSALFFDIFFTIEFLTRLIIAIKNKKGKYYFFHQNGWVDFLSSIPLLLFVSAPYFLENYFHLNLTAFSQFNNLGLIKIIKAIRVTRILRFLRVLKIFGKIKNVNSQMAQRQISVISTLVVFFLILFLFLTSILQHLDLIPSNYQQVKNEEEVSNLTYSHLFISLPEPELIKILPRIPDQKSTLLMIIYQNKTLYQAENIAAEKIRSQLSILKQSQQNYYENDQFAYYTDIAYGNLAMIYSRQYYQKSEAMINLLNFFLIILLLLCITIFYTRHFAQTVTDPIFVMRHGFEKRDYTLAVKIPEIYKDDDIFLLANAYNNRWLPAKMRKLDELRNRSSILTLNDVFGKSKDK